MRAFYYNKVTLQSTWDHPMDAKLCEGWRRKLNADNEESFTNGKLTSNGPIWRPDCAPTDVPPPRHCDQRHNDQPLANFYYDPAARSGLPNDAAALAEVTE